MNISWVVFGFSGQVTPLTMASSSLAAIFRPTKIHIAGYVTCPYYARATATAQGLVKQHPSFSLQLHEKSANDFRAWVRSPGNAIEAAGNKPNFVGATADTHTSCPFIWFEDAESGDKQFIGGRDRFTEWIQTNNSVLKAQHL